MTNTAKILVPDKEWIVQGIKGKIGSISKHNRGYRFIFNGKSMNFKSLNDVKTQLGISYFEENKKISQSQKPKCVIYDFPCSTEPHNPVYSVKNKLPLYAKNDKSKSQYCAGYYVIKFSKGWSKSFCPKLITIERYPYHGPFKTLQEVKTILNDLNKNENT